MINDPTLPETDAPVEPAEPPMEPPTDAPGNGTFRPGDNYDGPKIEISEEMRNSYLGYAMSTIISRALPDVRDGLKPVQRRILYAMRDLNLTPANRHLKSGENRRGVHWKLSSAHGDQAIYMTMVRMAQPFSLRYPLVDGQGNFGSIDDDPPAAYRYTEARMTALAVEMLEDIEKNTVDFEPTFDNERMQPTVLPGKFPHLICNGGSGIAVAMANNMAPHNLTEVCEAATYLLEHPERDHRTTDAVHSGAGLPDARADSGQQGHPGRL